MNGPARLGILSAIVFCAAGVAHAQPSVQPAPAPLVTAETEHWYQTGEPLEYAGNLYYRAGAPLYFNGIEMVRTGYYKGVPLYSTSTPTIEPSNIVFVPLSGGFVQPYERLARGKAETRSVSSRVSVRHRPRPRHRLPGRADRAASHGCVPDGVGADGRASRRRTGGSCRRSRLRLRARRVAPPQRALEARTPAGRRRQTASSSSSTAPAGSAAARRRTSTRRPSRGSAICVVSPSTRRAAAKRRFLSPWPKGSSSSRRTRNAPDRRACTAASAGRSAAGTSHARAQRSISRARPAFGPSALRCRWLADLLI